MAVAYELVRLLGDTVYLAHGDYVVLAPVALHYIRIEASKISVNHNTEKGRPEPALAFTGAERGID